MDSENEKLVVREPEDEDGECQASQNSAGSGQVWSPECLGMVSFLQEIPTPSPDALGLFAMG